VQYTFETQRLSIKPMLTPDCQITRQDKMAASHESLPRSPYLAYCETTPPLNRFFSEENFLPQAKLSRDIQRTVYER
jgi:hypothetical protein